MVIQMMMNHQVFFGLKRNPTFKRRKDQTLIKEMDHHPINLVTIKT